MKGRMKLSVVVLLGMFLAGCATVSPLVPREGWVEPTYGIAFYYGQPVRAYEEIAHLETSIWSPVRKREAALNLMAEEAHKVKADAVINLVLRTEGRRFRHQGVASGLAVRWVVK